MKREKIFEKRATQVKREKLQTQNLEVERREVGNMDDNADDDVTEFYISNLIYLNKLSCTKEKHCCLKIFFIIHKSYNIVCNYLHLDAL